MLNPLSCRGSPESKMLVGWLFWALRPFETVFQSVSGRLPERGRKKREVDDEMMRDKMSKQPPSAPTASTIGSCPTIIQISRTPRHWKFTQHLRTTRPPHRVKERAYSSFSTVSQPTNVAVTCAVIFHEKCQRLSRSQAGPFCYPTLTYSTLNQR